MSIIGKSLRNAKKHNRQIWSIIDTGLLATTDTVLLRKNIAKACNFIASNKHMHIQHTSLDF